MGEIKKSLRQHLTFSLCIYTLTLNPLFEKLWQRLFSSLVKGAGLSSWEYGVPANQRPRFPKHTYIHIRSVRAKRDSHINGVVLFMKECVYMGHGMNKRSVCRQELFHNLGSTSVTADCKNTCQDRLHHEQHWYICSFVDI